jgi:hypothetical protein
MIKLCSSKVICKVISAAASGITIDPPLVQTTEGGGMHASIMLKIQERTHMKVLSDVVPKRNWSRKLIGKQSWEKRDERAHRTRNKTVPVCSAFWCGCYICNYKRKPKRSIMLRCKASGHVSGRDRHAQKKPYGFYYLPWHFCRSIGWGFRSIQ